MQSMVQAQACGSLDELLAPDVLREVGLFVPQRVHKLLAKVHTSAWVSEMDEMALCGILTTQLWYQTFIKRSQPVSTILSCEK